MFGNCKVYMDPEVHYFQKHSIKNMAIYLALPANHMLHQRLRYKSPLFKISKRIAYNMLVIKVGDLVFLAEVGQFSGVTNGLPIAKKYVLLCGEKSNSCQSHNQLRYNYACSMSDTSASLLIPANRWYLSTRTVGVHLCVMRRVNMHIIDKLL